MSHSKERAEKNCLNCGAAVYGKYCHICGQENIETKETFWSLITHFIYDITHFDGKFFSTLKYLLFKPGFLSNEYIIGRRNSYLNPIKMYVFTSAFFFFIFFTFFGKGDPIQVNIQSENAIDIINDLKFKKLEYIKALSKTNNTELVNKYKRKINEIESNIHSIIKDSTNKTKIINEEYLEISFSSEKRKYTSIREYDSIQASLPKTERDNFFVAAFEKTEIKKQQKFGNSNKAFWNYFSDKLKHNFPQMLFISLPFFALFLMALYFRKKELYYANHIIFTTHLYCATFIIILLNFITESIAKTISIFQFIDTLLPILGFVYWYLAIKRFYNQNHIKTLIKLITLLVLNVILMIFLLITFFLFAAISI